MASYDRDTFLYLPDGEIDALAIQPHEIVDAIEAALVAKSEGRLHVAPKSTLLPGDKRYVMSTLAVGGDDLTVLKTVSVSPDNPRLGLPSINGAILVLDAETGLLRSVMGANWITAHRTAALSAVAARRMADPASTSIGFVGCGIQARSHLAAFRALFPMRQVLACARSAATRDAFCEEARALGLNARATGPEETLREADIVVTSITLDYAVAPFLDAAWIKPSAFAAITDLCIPWYPDSLTRFGTIVVDDIEQEQAAERPMLDVRTIAGDLTDLITERIDHLKRPAAFAFRGAAIGDFAAAALVYARALETGAGQVVAMDSGS